MNDSEARKIQNRANASNTTKQQGIAALPIILIVIAKQSELLLQG